MHRKLILSILFLLLGFGTSRAQQEPIAEFFCGAELNYADRNFTRLYDALINLTPGFKVNLGHDWQIAGQVFLPIVNEGYAERNSMFRLNMANISKELHFENALQYFKLTAGLFGKERFGGDLRWMYPVTSWLMLNARFGLTNHWALGMGWDDAEAEFGDMKWNLSANVGASIWLDSWKTELRGNGGRYLNNDYGVEGEIIRHFKHCSVSIFAQLHEAFYNVYDKNTTRTTGGFRVVMILPPYKKQKSEIVVRPASNFRLTYNAQSDGYSMRKYTTDPEENERIYPIRIPWATGNFDE